MASKIANFASCLGKYDATLTGAGFLLDVSGAIGTSDLSLNSGYLTNSTGFVMPAATTGNGISFTGWFNPTVAEPSNYTPIFDVSCGATQSITLCVSGNSLSPILVGNFNGNQVYGTTATANTWNFFAYTICCSGSTMVQTLFVNGTTTSVTSGTYTALTFASTLVGYGYGTFAQQFIGKIDDFRYYGRVLTPMEMRVLNSYSYGKTGFASLTPSLGTISVGTLTVSSVPLTFTNTGTYSYMGVKRTQGGISSIYNISPTQLVTSGSSYTWTDASASFAVYSSASYVITPYILGTPGTSQSFTATIPAPTAISSVFVFNAGIGLFDVSWNGGSGIGVSYLYDVSTNGAIISTGSYTTTALGTTNPTRITLTDTSVKTYTIVVKATNLIGTVTSVASGSVTTVSPIIYTGRVMPLPSSGTSGANTLAMTANSTTISGITGTNIFMNGNYVASSSSDGQGTLPWVMFDGINTTWWICNYGGSSYGQDAYNGSPSYSYRGGASGGQFVTSIVSGQTISGEWLQMKFPYAFILTGYSYVGRSSPYIGYAVVIAGSNDGTTWTQVESKTYTPGTVPASGTVSTISTPSTIKYSYYRVICILAPGNFDGNELSFYGSN